MATMKDVAKHADVSIATVSKFLNGGNVLDENEQKIKKAIKELDYRVNEIARGLKTNETKTVGVLIPSLKSIFFTSIISHIEDILQKNGYSTIVCDYQEDKNIEKAKIEFLIDKMVDGMILVPYKVQKKAIKKVLKNDIHLILLDRMIAGVDCDTVLTDSVNGSYQAVAALFKKGHNQVGIITGPEDNFTSRERLRGYRRAHEDYNIEIDENLIKFADYKVQGGYEKTMEIWETNRRPTALYVTNYEMTVGSLMAVNELRINVPEQLSLIGFDDILQLSKIFKPSLSIVSQPMEEIGKRAAELLLQRIKGEHGKCPEVIRLKTELILRGSVCDRS